MIISQSLIQMKSYCWTTNGFEPAWGKRLFRPTLTRFGVLDLSAMRPAYAWFHDLKTMGLDAVDAFLCPHNFPNSVLFLKYRPRCLGRLPIAWRPFEDRQNNIFTTYYALEKCEVKPGRGTEVLHPFWSAALRSLRRRHSREPWYKGHACWYGQHGSFWQGICPAVQGCGAIVVLVSVIGCSFTRCCARCMSSKHLDTSIPWLLSSSLRMLGLALAVCQYSPCVIVSFLMWSQLSP